MYKQMQSLRKYYLTSIELCNTDNGILTLLFVLRIDYYSLTTIQTMIKLSICLYLVPMLIIANLNVWDTLDNIIGRNWGDF